MNTSYTTPIPLLGSTRAGVDFEQLFVLPTVAYKLTDHQAIGISLNIGWQRFSGEGLQRPGFRAFARLEAPRIDCAPLKL